MTDDRLPILVAGGQLTTRVDDWRGAPSPLDRFEQVVVDNIAGATVEAADTVVALPTHHWEEVDPAAALAERLRLAPRRTVLAGGGGEIGLVALNWIAEEVLEGRIGTALLAATHLGRTARLRQADEPDMTFAGRQDRPAPERVPTAWKPPTDPAEDRAGLSMPIQLYPVIESALRARAGLGLDEHRQVMGRLMAPFTEVAACNPHAWFPVARSAEELVTPTPANRMICFPYTKYLNAAFDVDQSVAVVVTSVGEARRLGIPEDRWVHWWGGAAGSQGAYTVSSRPDLAEAPAMEATHRAALANAGVTVDEIARFDLYSCFPAPVELACRYLGLAHDDPRGLTVTGGLPYHGGPSAGYGLHALAEMCDVLRASPGELGMCTGNGMFVTNHSAVVLSTRPPRADRPVSASPEAMGAGGPPLPVVQRAAGRGVIDGWTVVHDRAGLPVAGGVIGHYDDGARFVANVLGDAESLAAFEATEQVGAVGSVHEGPGGGLRFDPA